PLVAVVARPSDPLRRTAPGGRALRAARVLRPDADPQHADLVAEGVPGHSQGLRSTGPVAVKAAQRLLDAPALLGRGAIKGVPPGRARLGGLRRFPSRRTNALRQVPEPDPRVVAGKDGGLDRVGELANVAGPGVRVQTGEGGGIETAHGPVVAAGVVLQEVREQEIQIAFSFPQGGEPEG